MNAPGRAETLARDLEDANARLIAGVRALPDDQWHTAGANAPGWRFDDPEDERRTIAQIAHHTALQNLSVKTAMPPPSSPFAGSPRHGFSLSRHGQP